MSSCKGPQAINSGVAGLPREPAPLKAGSLECVRFSLLGGPRDGGLQGE